MKKLFILLLIVSANLFCYDSVYEKICTTGTFKLGTPYTKLQDTCKKINNGKLSKTFYQDPKLLKDYKEIIKSLEQTLDRELTKKNREMVVSYIDGMNLLNNNTEEKYNNMVKQIIKTAIENEKDLQGPNVLGLTASEQAKIKQMKPEDAKILIDKKINQAKERIFGKIKNLLKELRPLQLDVKQGSEIIRFCNKGKLLNENEAKMLCGIALEPSSK